MRKYYAVGMDVHKKTISYCVINACGERVAEGRINANRTEIGDWVKGLRSSFRGQREFGMEATMFTAWIYDYLESLGCEVKVGSPHKLKAIGAGKKKNDRMDARALASLLQSNFFPECFMLPRTLRELRQALRYRNLLKRESTRFKNRLACFLMEVGEEYDSDKLHQKRYFTHLMDNLQDTPASVKNLLKLARGSVEAFEQNQRMIVRELEKHTLLSERVTRLQSIRGVGPITALTWALEIGDPWRFSSVKKAVSYCGLCSALHESAGKSTRGPLSKQRNPHIQWVLIEAAKKGPTFNPQLKEARDKALAEGANSNQATLAVARKLVAYLMCVDKTQKEFTMFTKA